MYSSLSPIEFYFDFGSPYGWLASERIEHEAQKAGRTCQWNAIILGPIFQQTGGSPYADNPVKYAYALHDWKRMSTLQDLPYKLPQQFPFGTLRPARGFYWMKRQHPALLKDFAKTLYRKCICSYKGDKAKEVNSIEHDD